MSTTKRALHGLSLVVAMSSAFSAVAKDGRIPIPFSSPVVTPITITQPGSYVLTRNIGTTGMGAIIDVNIPGPIPGDVDIDLNGFILDNSGNGMQNVVQVSLPPGVVREVKIHDGVINGGARGIEVRGGGGSVARKVVIHDVQISGTLSDAIWIENVSNAVVKDCVIVEAGGAAIGVVGAMLPQQAVIEGNVISNSGRGVLLTSSATLKVVNNAISNITIGRAIDLTGCLSCVVADNTIRSANGGGQDCVRLNACSGSRIADNVVFSCGDHGIRLDSNSHDNLVLRNTVRSVVGVGLLVEGSRNQIEGNVLNSNGQRGLVLNGNNNVYRGNTARGNTGAGACGGACSADFCNGGGGNTSQNDNFLPAAPCN